MTNNFSVIAKLDIIISHLEKLPRNICNELDRRKKIANEEQKRIIDEMININFEESNSHED